jgi:hypothetical protein
VDTRRSVAEIIKNIDENGMDSAYGDPKSAVHNGWRDWFCDEFMLKHRTKKFLPILYGITGEGKVNSGSGVGFRNILSNRMYDDMSLTTGECTLYMKNNPERDGAIWSVHTLYDGSVFNDREYKFDSTQDLVSWLNTPWGQPDPQKTSRSSSAESDGKDLLANESSNTDFLGDSDSNSFSKSDMVDMLEVIEEIFYQFEDELSDRQYNILDKVMNLIAKQIDG